MYIFVLDKNRQPLNPISTLEAETLLKRGKAAIFRQFPKTVILKETAGETDTIPYRLKIYPGTSVTGMVIMNEASKEIVFATQLEHRGQEIKQKLLFRAKCRRRRRNANLRYRQPRFSNRKASNPICRICGSNAVHSLGYCRSCYSKLEKDEINFSVMGSKPLFPSVESRCQNIYTWVKKLVRSCPISAISFELTRYDPDHIKDWVYSELEPKLKKAYFYELRDYLLSKWEKKCTYCGKGRVNLKVDNLPAEEKHLNNYVLICPDCQEKKKQGDLKLSEEEIQTIREESNRLNVDEKMINLSRNRILYLIQQLEIPVEVCSGGVTRLNTRSLGLKNYSWQKAICVGISTPSQINLDSLNYILNVKSIGHGSRKMCTGYQTSEKTNPKTGRKFTPRECGYFPMSHRPKGDQRKNYFGFKIGDVVKLPENLEVTDYDNNAVGTILKTWDNGMLTVLCGRKRLKTHHEQCEILQHSDGYFYSLFSAY